MMIPNYTILPGKSRPLGATVDDEGVNFSIYSEHATRVELLLFRQCDDRRPFCTIKLDNKINKDYYFWHIYIKGLPTGTHYNFRVDGPYDLSQGHRFNPKKLLIDPYTKGKTMDRFQREDAIDPNKNNVETALRGVVIDTRGYDWEGDMPLNRPLSESIIYEMHVGGFTKNKNSQASHPGSFHAIVEKIPYLKELGITAVELLPVFGFDDKTPLRYQQDGTPLYNYWGYDPIAFFAPHAGYCVSPELGHHINEFRDMVKALHKAGIEVILDVVFNHTDEGNQNGPYFHFKGLGNLNYYHLLAEDKSYYMDYSGCGNTLKASHPIMQKFIMDCLAFWVEEMHVDGFRFDEGSILSRDDTGALNQQSPILWAIELSDCFAETKLIAEVWDAAGLYLVGIFPGYRFSEWNGKYRDVIRQFGKGDPGIIGEVASRIAGSEDLFGHAQPTNSINFITAHDGFTLMDLVSYEAKHNIANGENNRDGNNDNRSWNSGIEGFSSDPDMIFFRKKRIKNFITMLMLSAGVPMITSGDEVGKSYQGNNNVYCQNNELAWFDWDLLETNKDLFNFFKEIIAFRKNNSYLTRRHFFRSETTNNKGLKALAWHGVQLNKPGWDTWYAKALAFTMGAIEVDDQDIHVMMNMDNQPLNFELPIVEGYQWYRFVDTHLSAPYDITTTAQPEIASNHYMVQPYSIVIVTLKG